MIFYYKNIEYCLTNYNYILWDVIVRTVINPITGKSDYNNYIGLSKRYNYWSITCSGEMFYDIKQMYQKIYSEINEDQNDLNKCKEKLDNFLKRVDTIKAFI